LIDATASRVELGIIAGYFGPAWSWPDRFNEIVNWLDGRYAVDAALVRTQ
jgi:hypothetical protein